MSFPIFCRGENPIDALGYWALTKYQVPIIIDDVVINPGDYSFASKDGVIIVRKSILKEFRQVALEQLAREKKVKHIINNTDKNYSEIVEELGRW